MNQNPALTIASILIASGIDPDGIDFEALKSMIEYCAEPVASPLPNPPPPGDELPPTGD